MFKRTNSLIGLDLGSSSLKAVELSHTGYDFTITACCQKEAPPDSLTPEFISEAIREAGFKGKRVATAVSGKSVIVRYLNMVEMSEEELRSSIRFEADKYIPFDIEEVILDCHRFEGLVPKEKEGASEMRVLLVAVKRSLIEDHIKLIEQAGLVPEIIDVEFFALGNAFELNCLLRPQMEEDRVVGLIDIGANKTNINIVENGFSFFTREIYFGGNDFTNAIAKQKGIDFFEAEVLKRDPGEEIGEIQESLIHSIDDLINEINLSFDYFENQFDRKVDEIYLSGGGGKFSLLPETLEKGLEKKITLWNPLESLKVKGDKVSKEELEEHASQLAIAVGLASRIRKE